MQLKLLFKAASSLLVGLSLASLTSCGGGGGGNDDDFTVRPSSLEGVTLTMVGTAPGGGAVSFTFNASDSTADISDTNPIETGGVVYNGGTTISNLEPISGVADINAFWPTSVTNLSYTYEAVTDTIGSISITSNAQPQYQTGVNIAASGTPHAFLNNGLSLNLIVTFQATGNVIGTSSINITSTNGGPAGIEATNNLTFFSTVVGTATTNVAFPQSINTPPGLGTLPPGGITVAATAQGNFSVDGGTAPNLPVNYSSAQSNLNFTGNAPVSLTGATIVGTNFADPAAPGIGADPSLNFEWQFSPTPTALSADPLVETGTLNITGTSAIPPRIAPFAADYVYTRDSVDGDGATLEITPQAGVLPAGAMFIQGGVVTLNFTASQTPTQSAAGNYTTPGNASTPSNQGNFTTLNLPNVPPFTL